MAVAKVPTMAGYLLRTVPLTLLALGVVLAVSSRWSTRKTSNTARNFGIMAAVVVGLVVWLSATAVVTEVRCPDNPAEWCEYNSNVPAIAVTTCVFVLLCAGRAWVIYENR